MESGHVEGQSPLREAVLLCSTRLVDSITEYVGELLATKLEAWMHSDGVHGDIPLIHSMSMELA